MPFSHDMVYSLATVVDLINTGAASATGSPRSATWRSSSAGGRSAGSGW
ncbi:hypothetical protein [Microbispora sp. GKU 823]|nr:hypothetical protein [Microbispora sp. GKU 823]